MMLFKIVKGFTNILNTPCIKANVSLFVRHKSRRVRGNVPKKIYDFEDDLVSGDQTIFKKNNSFVYFDSDDKDEAVEADSIGQAFANRILERLDEDDNRFSAEIIKARKAKAINGTIILEGYRLIRDALLAGGEMQSLFFTDRDILYKIPHLCPDADLYFTRYRHHKRWSTLTTPPGALAIFQLPDNNKIIDKRPHTYLPVSLILDNIRDPGNLGTLIRSAAALNLERVLLSTGCVDVWESKVLRSAMGSHFYIPIYNGVSIASLNSELSEQTVVHLADSSSSLKPKVNNSDDLPQLDDEEESLDDIVSDMLPVPYFNVSFNNSGQPLALIIGGESCGLSAASYRLSHRRNGSRLFIPLANTVESLNSAIAASIITSEIQRQFLIISDT